MKTAIELSISEAEHLALQAVAIGMANGEYIEHHPGIVTDKKLFNMMVPCIESICGTIACIGGWAAIEMGMNLNDAGFYVCEIEEPLHDLYYPITDWDKITPSVVAEVIYNFLETGIIDFESVVESQS
jgi:hypothetical protein